MATRNNGGAASGGMGGGTIEADCDYVYKGKDLKPESSLVVLSGDMGVGKSNILQR